MFLLSKSNLRSVCTVFSLSATLFSPASAMMTSDDDINNQLVVTNKPIAESTKERHLSPHKKQFCRKENPLQDQGLKPYFNILFGAQFFLRPVFPEDYTAFVMGLMDADHVKYYWHGNPLSPEETREYTREQALDNTATHPKMLNWSVITHQGIAGNVNLQMPNEEWPQKAIGYFICPDFAGRGLATEASRLMMSTVEGPFIATVHPENKASSNVLKKLGFTIDPTRLSVPRYGSVRDYYLLSNHQADTHASLGDVLEFLAPSHFMRDLQLGVEPAATLKDCLDVALNLHSFNKKVLGSVPHADLRISSDNTLLGEVYQNSIEIDDKTIGPLCYSPAKFHKRLYDIEQVAHLWEVRKSYISCHETSPLPPSLVKEGFLVVATYPDLEKGGVILCFKKELNAKIVSPTAQDITFRPGGEYTDDVWSEFIVGEITKLPNRFGVFLRANDKIRGGVWGHIWNPEDHNDCGIPHAFIHFLHVNETLKGQGWGKVLMREAEDFAISQGARYLQLDTYTFQAPYFYQKLGFRIEEVKPHDMLVQGKPNSRFMCTKQLFENPHKDRGLKPYYNSLIGSQFFLRPVFPEDYSAFLPVVTDATQMKYLGYGKPITIEMARQNVLEQSVVSHSQNPERFNWSVITRQGIAGRIFLTSPTNECPEKELGYFICPAFAGRGLATEASRLAMSFMEGPFMATAHPENLGSVAVLKKLGFKTDPNRLGAPKYGSIRDYYLLQSVE